MDMKRILQAMDGVATKPVAGANDMKKFMSVVTEGANPHKVALPVQMAMNHYQEPSKKVESKVSGLKKYFAEAEEKVAQELAEESAAKQTRLKMYAEKIANRILTKESAEAPAAAPAPVAAPAARNEATIQKEINVQHKHLAKIEHALSKARETTKQIKYDDTISNIVVGIRSIATDDLGIDKQSLKYAEEAVFEAVRNLEAAVYGLEEAFEEAHSSIKNKVDDLEGEIDEIHWNRKYGNTE